jgi:hypothetical protein
MVDYLDSVSLGDLVQKQKHKQNESVVTMHRTTNNTAPA